MKAQNSNRKRSVKMTLSQKRNRELLRLSRQTVKLLIAQQRLAKQFGKVTFGAGRQLGGYAREEFVPRFKFKYQKRMVPVNKTGRVSPLLSQAALTALSQRFPTTTKTAKRPIMSTNGLTIGLGIATAAVTAVIIWHAFKAGQRWYSLDED